MDVQTILGHPIPTLAEVVARDGREPTIQRLMGKFGWSRQRTEEFLVSNGAM